MREKAKIKIQDLIRKYESVKNSGRIGKYTEEETKKDFILPLFAALGWGVIDKNEVTAEEQVSGNRVDYGFYLNGRIKFYLEAKPLKADLHREDYAKQAIRYSWNKGVTWAVLTDFEGLIIFNALSPEKSLAGKKYLAFTYQEYLTRFNELWRLSKEAFSEDILDKEAEKVGKKLQKVSVTETLSKDLNECREILTKAFLQWNEKVDSHLIDEGVQKLLNRLIFIRSAEDRKIEPPTLIPLIHEWESSGKVGQISPYQAMVKKFRELDVIYDSNLFDEHPFEKWEEFGGATGRVIDILHGKKNYFEYDFSIIPADVLGNVYENYLGHQLKKSKKEEHLGKNLKKRKEQGIYYTPKFIVDYIVQNALGPVLDKCKSINDLQKVKILDPACGSGSFLVAAMNFLIRKYEEFNIKSSGLLKIQILQNNIYGVDLDQQAVELARLNLLLNTFDSQIKLPGLENNIKNGNSLISGTDEELKKYFGKNYRDKNPFNWQEEFPEVFKQGGFDCIIGNPPYLSIERGLLEDLHYFREKFSTIEKIFDIFGLFIEKSIQILKKDGYFGFIIPNILLMNDSFSKLRKKILNETQLISINNYKDGVFEDAVVPTVVIVSHKNIKPADEYNILVNVFEKNQLLQSNNMKSTDFRNEEFFRFNLSTSDQFLKFKNKLFENSKDLALILKVQEALKTGDDKKFISNTPFNKPNNKTLLKGADIFRYSFIGKHFIDYEASMLKRPGKQEIFELSQKLYIRRIANRIIAALDDKQRYAVHTLYTGVLTDKKFNYKYLLGLLNSRLFSYLYGMMFPFKGSVFPEIRIGNLGKLPVKITDNQKPIVVLVERIIELNKKINKLDENSDQWRKIKDEIVKTDKKIDEKVYELYGLTGEEIKMVDNSSKK